MNGDVCRDHLANGLRRLAVDAPQLGDRDAEIDIVLAGDE